MFFLEHSVDIKHWRSLTNILLYFEND